MHIFHTRLEIAHKSKLAQQILQSRTLSLLHPVWNIRKSSPKVHFAGPAMDDGIQIREVLSNQFQSTNTSVDSYYNNNTVTRTVRLLSDCFLFRNAQTKPLQNRYGVIFVHLLTWKSKHCDSKNRAAGLSNDRKQSHEVLLKPQQVVHRQINRSQLLPWRKKHNKHNKILAKFSCEKTLTGKILVCVEGATTYRCIKTRQKRHQLLLLLLLRASSHPKLTMTSGPACFLQIGKQKRKFYSPIIILRGESIVGNPRRKAAAELLACCCCLLLLRRCGCKTDRRRNFGCTFFLPLPSLERETRRSSNNNKSPGPGTRSCDDRDLACATKATTPGKHHLETNITNICDMGGLWDPHNTGTKLRLVTFSSRQSLAYKMSKGQCTLKANYYFY